MSRVRDIRWSYVDPECISVIKAINAVPGLATTGSCCGHGRQPFEVWFKLTDTKKIHNLQVIAFATDRRYCCPVGWHAELVTYEMRRGLPHFLLTSEAKGEQAYKEAEKVAECILERLHHKKFSKMFLTL